MTISASKVQHLSDDFASSAEDAQLDEAWRLGCSGEPDEALKCARSAVARIKAGAGGNIGRAHFEIAWYCFQCGLADRGLSHARLAVRACRKSSDKEREAQARALEAWLLLELGMVELAVEVAMDALALADQGNDLRTRSFALNVVGIVFWATHKPQQAVDFVQRAIDIAREAGNRNFECWWLINLGGAHSDAAYKARSRHDEPGCTLSVQAAIRYTEQAAALADELGDGWAKRLCLGNLAEYLNIIHENEQAAYVLAAYPAVAGVDTARGRGHYLLELSRTLIALRHFDEAMHRLQEALALSEQTKNTETMMLANMLLSSVHEEKENFRDALGYYKRYNALQQQYVAERTQRQARLAEIHYETRQLRTQANAQAKRADDLVDSYKDLQLRAEALTAAVNVDPLTGLANRRRLEGKLDELDNEARPLSIAMLDIDHFKKVNDVYSHTVGDQVLRQTGAILARCVRDCDFVARYGGEEFSLLFVDITGPEALDICERLREAIASWSWNAIAAGLRVTVSIGLATRVADQKSRDLLTLADEQLYAAKRSGRNCVLHDNLGTPGPEAEKSR
jgi:diguanylate cyclase (GGDEF)-like protein